MLLLSIKVIAIFLLLNWFGGIEAVDRQRSSDSQRPSFSFNRGRSDRLTEQGYLLAIISSYLLARLFIRLLAIFFHCFCDMLQIFKVTKA